MGSRTGSMLPVPHACAETGLPYGKGTFPLPTPANKNGFPYWKHASRTPRLCRNRLPVRQDASRTPRLPTGMVPVREARFPYPKPLQKQASRAGKGNPPVPHACQREWIPAPPAKHSVFSAHCFHTPCVKLNWKTTGQPLSNCKFTQRVHRVPKIHTQRQRRVERRRAAAGGGWRWRLGGRRLAAASGRGALRLGHQPAYNACGSPNSPTHPSPFCFYNFKTPNGVTFPNTTPVQKQGSRTGRQPSRSPRLPTGMGSRTGSMLPITHACAETGFPYGKATFP